MLRKYLLLAHVIMRSKDTIKKNSLGRLRHNVVIVEALQKFTDRFIDLHLVTRPMFVVPIHGYVEKKTLELKKNVYAGRARVRPTDSRAGNIKSSLCACLTINARSTVGTSSDTVRCLFTLLKHIFLIKKMFSATYEQCFIKEIFMEVGRQMLDSLESAID